VASEDQRTGTVEFATRSSDIACPVCGQPMRAFNYRAYNLELDACSEGHGFWLDEGESARVREVMRERVGGLRRAGSAQRSWQRAKGRGGGGVVDQIKGLFRR
jgi:Zn-finger nucleic acid-binding protein